MNNIDNNRSNINNIEVSEENNNININKLNNIQIQSPKVNKNEN